MYFLKNLFSSFEAFSIGHLILKNSLIIFEIFLPLLGRLGSLIFLSNLSKTSFIVLPAGLTSISPSSKRRVSILVRVSVPSVPEIVMVSVKPETVVDME